MRIKRLKLRYFGPFEEEEFDFPEEGIAFLYGLNGDGKTTLSRALVDLFYEIPSRRRARHDGWRFPSPNNPEIVAWLSGFDSQASGDLVVSRREEELYDEDGNELAVNPFESVVMGLGKEDFRDVYSIGHKELITNGRRLSTQEGDLGAIVLGAALGGSFEVKAVLDDLRSKADALFAPEGNVSGKKVTKDLARLSDKRSEIEASSTTPDKYAAISGSIEEKKQERESLEREKDDLEADAEAIETLLKVQPGLVKRKVMRGELEGFTGVRASAREIKALGQELAAVKLQMDRLEEFEKVLAGNELGELLESLGVTVGSDDDKGMDAAGKILTLREGELLEALRSSADPGRLDEEFRRRDRQLISDLEDLGSFPRQDGESDHAFVERFSRLEIPSREDVIEDQRQEEELRDRVAREATRRTEVQHQLEEKKRELESRSDREEVPDRESLEEARGKRTFEWEEIRTILVDGKKPSGEPAEMAEVYEDSVKAADEIADALVEEAEIVNIASEIKLLEQRAEAVEKSLEGAQAEAEQHLDACRERWKKSDELVGFHPASAEAMLAWIGRVEDLRSLRTELLALVIGLQTGVREAQKDLKEALVNRGGVAEEIEEFVGRVVELAAKVGTPPPAGAAEAVAEVEQLQEQLENSDKIDANLKELEMKLLHEGKKLADELEADLDDRDPEALTKEADALRREADGKVHQLDSLDGEINGLIERRREVSALGSFEIGRMRNEADELEQSIADDMESFLTLGLVVELLNDAKDSYRDTAAVEVRDRAQEIFLEITDGRFSHLETNYDGDNARITVVRSEPGKEVEIEDLSSGEGEALYLSFRLAALEHQLNQLSEKERPPVILDDVLLGLDNDRVKAGLEQILELSKLTQVIFLTHHGHMIDLAEEALDKGKGEWSLVKEAGDWADEVREDPLRDEETPAEETGA